MQPVSSLGKTGRETVILAIQTQVHFYSRSELGLLTRRNRVAEAGAVVSVVEGAMPIAALARVPAVGLALVPVSKTRFRCRSRCRTNMRVTCRHQPATCVAFRGKDSLFGARQTR